MAALAGLGGGCRSRRPAAVQPMTETQLRSIFSKAKDPRRYWLTPYESEDGTTFGNAHRLHPEQLAERPFISAKKGLLPVIVVQTDRVTEQAALLDSSSKENWITPSAAHGLGAVPLGPPAYEAMPEHVAEPVRGYACLLPNLRMDALHMENAIVYFRTALGPLGYLARADEKPAPGLVLGASFLRAFSFVQFDYAGRKVFFASTPSYSPSSDTLLAAVPLKSARGALAAEGLVDGQPFTIILDTAGDYEAAMTDPPAAPVRISLGDMVFPRVQPVPGRNLALGLPDHPRIGARLLARYKVTFAPKANLVYFERP